MAVIVATRYRVRLKALPAFMQHLRDYAVRLQLTPGFAGGKLRVELRQVFWLVEVWSGEPVALHSNLASHARSTSVTTWAAADPAVPKWRSVGAHADGRGPSRVFGLPIALVPADLSTQPGGSDGPELSS